MGAVHLRFEELQSFRPLPGPTALSPKRTERDSYLQALKGRDGLSSPSVPALVAHIAAYRDGAPWLDALRDYLQANMR